MTGQNTFWRECPTLVTGGSGLVGGWVVERLLAQGATVVCLVRDWVPGARLLSGLSADAVTLVRGDICDQALLEACRRSPLVTQIVLASSDKAYGDAAVLPFDESTPLRGQHPYDVSKSCADLIGLTYAHTYDLPVVVTRCGNLCGGGDLNWNRLVPGTIRSVLRGERPVIRSDGEFIRDYFYVEDGAAAYLHLAEQLATNRAIAGEAFNFSNEIQVTASALAEQIVRMMGSDLTLDIRNDAVYEIRHQYLSADRARRLLGWSPLFTLDEGLTRTIAWYRDHLQ